MGDTQTRAYRNGTVVAEGFPIADVSEFLAKPDTIVWVDFCVPTMEQLHQLASELDLHELAVEDAVGAHQRPKLDSYPSHRFLSCHAVRVDVEGGALDDTEIDAFMSERWFITVRKDESFSMEPVLKRWDRSGELASHGVSYLLYGLLDVVVDEYFRAADAFDAYYDRVSEAIFEERPIEPNNQRLWFQMRRALFQFHRLVVPMREVASALLRREHTLVPEELYPYFQDLYDHLLRLTETTDSLRDLVSTIVETNLSLRDYRQNLIVKRVGSWAAIFAVPALITGFYGMNVPYPGSGTHWGFAMSCVLMVVLSAWLYLSFRRRDWI